MDAKPSSSSSSITPGQDKEPALVVDEQQGYNLQFLTHNQLKKLYWKAKKKKNYDADLVYEISVEFSRRAYGGKRKIHHTVANSTQ